jgi:murein hydrolase activator
VLGVITVPSGMAIPLRKPRPAGRRDPSRPLWLSSLLRDEHRGVGRRRRLGILQAVLLLAAGASWSISPAQAGRPAGADATREQLQETERARADSLAAQRDAAARAAAAAGQEKQIEAARATAAEALRRAEQATLAVAQRMDALARERQAADARLKEEAAALAPLLPVVERLSLYPSETLLAAPGSREDAVRGLIILQGLSRRIEAEALALRQTQAEEARTTRALQAQMPEFARAEAAQAAQAHALDKALALAEAGRRQAVDEAAAAARQAAADAGRAVSLRSVITTLEAARSASEQHARMSPALARQRALATSADGRRQDQAVPGPAETASLGTGAAPRSQLTIPVAGTILRGWGTPGDGGPAAGITYQAAPAARVAAMCGGRVEFAAPFRSYGLLLILDCGGGYHAVMAGFDQLDAKVGQLVRAGQPVGAMPSWAPGQPGPRPSLYVELRRGDQPIDPSPWLKAGG